ncbi:sugar transferase [Vibrio breoganii]|uniref:sugar transferase n=1 Tax=Vibrio breoganii TaxID=553239 RepID=UPI000C849686|nr:sugar transferase [Vibrio breoganii]
MYKLIKRTFDVIVSFSVLVVFSPILLLLSLFIYKDLGSPIFFKQERVGKGNKTFTLIKFRTMKVSSNKQILTDAQRLTNVGRFIRSTSLDELPGLLNVLRGDMSLVGPRPLLVEYLPLYDEEQIKRHNTLPGITGWAQVNGRNSISWSKKFELDIWYVENQSFLLDAKILVLTAVKVLKREGVTSENNATIDKFKGNEND